MEARPRRVTFDAGTLTGVYGDIEPRTAAERAFLTALLSRIPTVDVRPHGTDADPWLLVARDFIEENQVRDTLRLDFDGSEIAGGWSPSFLNGDDGVRAQDARPYRAARWD